MGWDERREGCMREEGGMGVKKIGRGEGRGR